MSNMIINSFIWKLLERFGVQSVSFVVQLILARLLDPIHYGTLSLMVIFTNLANILVQSGFSTALIQNKDVNDDDYSSVFWISELIALLTYFILFICAPLIASFYNMPDIIVPFRILSLVLIPGAYNSIQLAMASKELNFKAVFKSSINSALVSGIIGIYIAYTGGGLWALVIQTLLNAILSSIVMSFIVDWSPRLVCNFDRVKVLFSFGWKLLCSSLLDTLYQDLRSLVVGKKYDSTTLAYYNRGKQFPQFVINAVNGTVQSVMLPVMSKKQDDKESIKYLTRNSISISAFIIFPVMAGLAAVATPLVKLLLTDKWIECVPYLQIYCFTFAFYPVHSCNLQALNAMGRSDLFLKLEIIKKIYGIIAIVIAVFCFDSPIAICMTGLITTWIGWFVNSRPNKRLLNYSMKEQFIDLAPTMLITIIMFVCVLFIGKLNINNLLLLIIQVLSGIVIYVLLAIIVKPNAYVFLKDKGLDIIKGLKDKHYG